MHDKRKGGDISHVDLEATKLNEILLAGPQWKETIKAEVQSASIHTLQENIDALLAKSREREMAQVKLNGLVDPWQLCEGILTVNKEKFGSTAQKEWGKKKVAEFRDRAMAFLKVHFPDDQLRYASAHADEEACHIYFVVAVWTERVTANRGCQRLLQASKNHPLGNYEYVPTLAGEAFSEIGLVRGERHAEGRRHAKVNNLPLPELRRHTPPSKWRQEQIASGKRIAEAKIEKPAR